MSATQCPRTGQKRAGQKGQGEGLRILGSGLEQRRLVLCLVPHQEVQAYFLRNDCET